jgi:hypothetical protein
VYDAARGAGLITNFGSYGLPALALACVSDGLLAEALSVSDDARSALLPLDVVVASQLLRALAQARMVPQVVHLANEVRGRRLSCDATSLRAALDLIAAQARRPAPLSPQLVRRRPTSADLGSPRRAEARQPR